MLCCWSPLSWRSSICLLSSNELGFRLNGDLPDAEMLSLSGPTEIYNTRIPTPAYPRHLGALKNESAYIKPPRICPQPREPKGCWKRLEGSPPPQLISQSIRGATGKGSAARPAAVCGMTSCILSMVRAAPLPRMKEQPTSARLLIAEPPEGEGRVGARFPAAPGNTITGRASKRPQASSGIINSELALFTSLSPSRFSEKLGRKSTDLAFFLSTLSTGLYHRTAAPPRPPSPGRESHFSGMGDAVPGAQGRVWPSCPQQPGGHRGHCDHSEFQNSLREEGKGRGWSLSLPAPWFLPKHRWEPCEVLIF